MRSFACGAAATVGMVVLLNARVLLFAAGFERMRRENPEMFDGGRASAAIAHVLDTEGHLYR